jgi:hypothetical protein
MSVATKIVIDNSNVDDYFSEVELFLNSLFDNSFTVKPIRVILENDTYRFTYEKRGIQYFLNLEVLSPTVDTREYHLITPGNMRKPLVPKSFRVTSEEQMAVTKHHVEAMK